MFDIGFPELLIVSVVALLVLGPERLPEALRTLGLWFGRMRRSFSAVKVEIEREIGMDEVRRQLHNEAILEEMRELESDVNTIQKDVTEAQQGADTELANARDTTVDELDMAMRDLEENVKAVDNGHYNDTRPEDPPLEGAHFEEGEATLEPPGDVATDDFEFSNEPHPDDPRFNKPSRNSGS